ncbi:unnamed protein product [Heterotrigona itama]|uniref:Uncharacterized protein n=1 Tax=Heterotrigona itama TaxID=395501 RepID=A0A6V7H3G6_9HYME|nr:unnamed protein product [Heterotrigona itama]
MQQLIDFFRYINPLENKMVAVTALGECWHNYIITCSREIIKWQNWATTDSIFNFTNFFAKFGLAYDLKILRIELVTEAITLQANLWDWGDKNQTKQNTDVTMVLRKEY